MIGYRAPNFSIDDRTPGLTCFGRGGLSMTPSLVTNNCSPLVLKPATGRRRPAENCSNFPFTATCSLKTAAFGSSAGPISGCCHQVYRNAHEEISALGYIPLI